MDSVSWDFEPRAAAFALTLRATFHKSVGGLSVIVPWLDASGAPAAAPLTVGPLSGCDPDPVGSTCLPYRPGATSVVVTRDLGSLPVTWPLVQAIRQAILQIKVRYPGPAGEVEVPGGARLHLGPLLLAGGADEAVPQEDGASAAEPSRWTRPGQPQSVSATLAETLGVAGLYRLEVEVSTDVPILSRPMLDRLLPICFTVDSLSNLPNESWLPDKCEDVYAEIYPQLSRVTADFAEQFPRIRSVSRPHDYSVRIREPMVWFLGVAPPNVVREWLQHEGLVVEVHDRDLKLQDAAGEAAPEGLDATQMVQDDLRVWLDRHGDASQRTAHPHGHARFLFGHLLRSRTLSLNLRGDVRPGRSDKKQRRAEAMSEPLRAKGLLEEEGLAMVAQRAKLDKREDTTDYHSMGAVVTMRAALAVPLPEALQVRLADEDRSRQTWEQGEQRAGEEGGIYAATSAEGAHPAATRDLPFRAKVTAPSGSEVAGPWRRKRERAEADEVHLQDRMAGLAEDAPEESTQLVQEAANELEAQAMGELNCQYERFGRIVVVIDETDLKSIRAILDRMVEWNASIMGIDPSSAEVNTYQLSEEDIGDLNLDIISGFAVLDGKARIIVLEGLRGQRRGLEAMLGVIDRSARPNSREFKMLHNSDIGFSQRLYAAFGMLKLKQIKIRQPLERFASKADLYAPSGDASTDTVEGAQAIKLLMELKQMSRLRALRKGCVFPKVAHLANLQILFGGYLSDAELEARPPTPEKKSQHKTAAHGGALAQGATAGCLQDAVVTMKPGAFDGVGSPGKVTRKVPLDMDNSAFEGSMKLRQSQSMPDFTKANRSLLKEQSEQNVKINDILGKKRTRQTPFLDGEQVYIYSGQTHNCVEKQKEWMRKHIDKEQDQGTWSYNAAYNTCNFEFSGAEDPGVKGWSASCPNDTYANLPGDERPHWRNPPPRPKEEYRKPPRDVGFARPEELHEAFVDQEWHTLPIGQERRKPIATHVRFEPDKIPHVRRVTERPFDWSRMQPGGRDFGPKSGNESVHYHGRMPRETLADEAERHNVRNRSIEEGKVRHGKFMRSFSQVSSRHCIQDADRYELMLKDAPSLPLRGRLDHTMPVSIKNHEELHEVGQPRHEWHSRLRENDSSPPYEVHTGTYIKRDPEVGTGVKRAINSGKLGKAPWRHGAEGPMDGTRYVSGKDFNATRGPPTKRQDESHVVKSATRSLTKSIEKQTLPYMRPFNYGVAIS